MQNDTLEIGNGAVVLPFFGFWGEVWRTFPVVLYWKKVQPKSFGILLLSTVQQTVVTKLLQS
jgi:hypothetical protein